MIKFILYSKSPAPSFGKGCSLVVLIGLLDYKICIQVDKSKPSFAYVRFIESVSLLRIFSGRYYSFNIRIQISQTSDDLKVMMRSG